MQIPELQHRVVDYEYGEVRLRRRFSIAGDAHVAVNCFPGKRGSARKARFDLQFPVRPSHREFSEGETLEWQFALAAGVSEVDLHEGVRRVFFFDRQLDTPGVA